MTLIESDIVARGLFSKLEKRNGNIYVTYRKSKSNIVYHQYNGAIVVRKRGVKVMRDNIFEMMNKIITSKKEKAIISIKQERNNQTLYVIHFLADIIIDSQIGITLDLQKIEQTVTGYNLGLQEGKKYLVDMEIDKENIRPKFCNHDSDANLTFFQFINSRKNILKAIKAQKR